MGNPEFRSMGTWWESAYDDGRGLDEPLDWRVDPKNKVSAILSDGSEIEAHLCPWLINETYDCEFRKDLGFYKIRYRVCSAAYIEGQKDFSVCALLSDGVWRKCSRKELHELAIAIGAYEQ